MNSNTPTEMKAKEIGGVSSHFHQQLFKDLKTKQKIHLENFVYYKDETHYFVMTATKASLLERRVFKADFLDASQLMERKNIDVQSLLAYARDAANFCTNNAMANISFAKNSRGVDDVAMLDFSSKFEAANASHVVERNGKKLLIGLIGDSLLEVCHISKTHHIYQVYNWVCHIAATFLFGFIFEILPVFPFLAFVDYCQVFNCKYNILVDHIFGFGFADINCASNRKRHKKGKQLFTKK